MTRRMTLRNALSTLGRDEENRKLKAEVRRLRKALRKAEAFLAETPNPMAFSAILFLRTQILCALRRGGKR